MPTATVKLRGPDDREHIQATVGTGPVDAVYQAIDAIVPVRNTLLEYNVHALTGGIDAQGEVTVRVASEGNGSRIVGGYGADTDIIVASAKAYLSALNRLLSKMKDDTIQDSNR
jgi:2-isopropylmalate synthase